MAKAAKSNAKASKPGKPANKAKDKSSKPTVKAKPAPKKPAGKAKAKPEASAKPTKPAKGKAAPAKPTKPVKGKAAPGKTAPASKNSSTKSAVLITKKTSATTKSGKATSIRATRGKAPTKLGKVEPKTPPKEYFPPAKLNASFLKAQRQKLLELKDNMVDAMSGVASETLRSRAQDSEASAFGMHQADAGSDAYDRDFALNLLSQEQDALYEIEEALARIDEGTYGICEMSGQIIPQARLEAIPFARFTVECQAQVERENPNGVPRRAIRSLFGLNADEEDEDSDEESFEEKDA